MIPNSDHTPLRVATKHGRFFCVQWLLRHGAVAAETDRSVTWFPDTVTMMMVDRLVPIRPVLHLVSSSAIMRMLLDAGANTSNSGWSDEGLIEMHIGSKHYECVYMLVDMGIKPRLPSDTVDAYVRGRGHVARAAIAMFALHHLPKDMRRELAEWVWGTRYNRKWRKM